MNNKKLLNAFVEKELEITNPNIFYSTPLFKLFTLHNPLFQVKLPNHLTTRLKDQPHRNSPRKVGWEL